MFDISYDIQYCQSISYLTYGSLIKETSTPLAMVFFGLWSVKNIRRMRRVAVAPVMSISKNHTIDGSHSIHAKDRQLIFMLLIDIVIYILFSSIVAITLLYSQFTQYEIKSLEQIQTELLIVNVAVYSAHIPFCITSYAHLLVSKTFRNELKRIFLLNRWF